jgi:ABC-type uncharacterized transport system ATPase subunit
VVSALPLSPKGAAILDAGVSHIPEDRTHVGTAPNLSITDNVIMKVPQSPLSHGWSIDRVEARCKANAP